jgi:hypothetical protein
MSQRTTGWVFVAIQAALLVTLVLLPGRDDFDTPSWLRAIANAMFWMGVALAIAAGLTLGRVGSHSRLPHSPSASSW